ncbi:MAG: GNAT family N-acetyltransferase [Verrucomicrobia bacterium]|nr:MAG: GNAT family N-acetyltransferase [Verrucomicrobiota bacterium]
MRPSLPVEVFAVAEQKWVAGTLFFGIAEHNLEHYEQKWLPELLKRRRETPKLLKAGHEIAAVEDAHWDWAKKMLREHRAPLGFRSCAVEVEGETEGLMQVELATHRSRANKNLNLAYVDYISIAPWNRPWPGQLKRFKGVGSILLREAIRTSMDEGFRGRIGLHSLPGALTWYRDTLRMKAFGADQDYQGLHYFEFTEEQAERFMDEK